jgi:hypothetical protein
MFSKQQMYDQGHRSAQLLENRGGFADSLAALYYKADMKNALRLRDAFPELLQVAPIGEEVSIDLDKNYFITQLTTYLEGIKNGR